MYENHIVVKYESIQNNQTEHQEDSKINSYQPISLLFIVVIVEPEIVTLIPISDYAINY